MPNLWDNITGIGHGSAWGSGFNYNDRARHPPGFSHPPFRAFGRGGGERDRNAHIQWAMMKSSSLWRYDFAGPTSESSYMSTASRRSSMWNEGMGMRSGTPGTEYGWEGAMVSRLRPEFVPGGRRLRGDAAGFYRGVDEHYSRGAR
ncbi:hypothetical protein K458DRAFT_429775 [Lentithecium fluviatile CBS 122367]|uniref:Uncharacterized protein n=1 Tax=Lentithecium fluviatile CBS 122367 TaxID=1168545 RepID=A0A6G1J8G8_9PLEO|nr:hypothetical protein K458DRAFT_429775 [Lentithecium fluviatile CBS 122367]